MANLSIVSGVLDIIASQGKTWTISITVRDAGNNLVNFTGYSARWDVRVNPYSVDTVLSLSNGSGITLTANGVITLTATAAQTADIPASSYVHEIELTDPTGAKPPFLAGNLKVVAEVVR